MRWVDFTWLYITLVRVGCLYSAPTSSDYGNHTSIRRQRRSCQLYAVSRFAAWPTFGIPRRTIHSVSHACDLQRWSPRRTIPKTIPTRYYFPTCQVRVVRFYVSCLLLSSSPLLLLLLNRDPRRTVFSVGPQPRPSTPSVPCRTSTTTIPAQCSLPDINHDHPRPVFPAGPQPRLPDRSGHCRTSTARMSEKMSDRMSEDMSERMSEDMPDRMSEDMPERMSEDMPDRMPEDMSEYMPEDLPDRMPEDRMPENMPEDMPDRYARSEEMPEDMPDRMPEDMSEYMPERYQICQIECQIECQKICQIECRKICQIECQKICQIECQKIECQKVC